MEFLETIPDMQTSEGLINTFKDDFIKAVNDVINEKEVKKLSAIHIKKLDSIYGTILFEELLLKSGYVVSLSSHPYDNEESYKKACRSYILLKREFDGKR